jgi:phospholipid/cholesterol/gamma-HCH transport system substrate-binding protein
VKISNEVKTAILGIVAILAFIFGYNYLKGSGVFSSTKTIFVDYDDVQNIVPASYVKVQGFTIGSVKNIYLSKKNAGKVTVEMQIEKTFKLPEDTKAFIISTDIMGTKAIQLQLGKSLVEAKPNSFIKGDVQLGILEELGGSVKPVMAKVDGAVTSIDGAVKGLDGVIVSVQNVIDARTQANIRNTVASASKSMDELNLFVKELSAQRSKIAEIMNSTDKFTTNINSNNAKINSIITNADKTTVSLANTDIAGTVKELKNTLDELKITINKMNNGNGTLAKLMNDDKLYKNLNSTLATTNNLIYDLSKHPSKYVNLSLFGGRKGKNDSPPETAPNAEIK